MSQVLLGLKVKEARLPMLPQKEQSMGLQDLCQETWGDLE